VSDGRFRRQTSLDQSRRRWSLDDDILARAAGVFRPPNDKNPELGWRDIELLADILADLVQFAPAARADLALDIDDGLDARQMRRQRAAVGAPFARAFRSDYRRCRIGFSRSFRLSQLDVFKAEQQLVGREALGAAAEAMALQVLDDLDEPFGTNPLGDQHRLQRFGIVGKPFGVRPHTQIRPYSLARCDARIGDDSLCRRSTGRNRRGNFFGLMYASPIEPF